ncbi:sugar ABC transporter substrate-binding protein [Luteimonas granuli]|uniref:Extracellular solute-binding protein n=1 Tax=Luteimonas granuli TaxID=1176533 RepID=A0A518N700_9GAMM|nr:sugar ABC transporter substrate-binding protein [Luteimonas granuli]QDW67695.1 extracellular solute-binding protein [Luteimonas granuli]
MRHWRIATLLVLLLAAALAALAGCTRRDAPGTTTIRFWAMGREAEVVAELLPEFERAHPGLRVEVQAIPWSAAHEKLLTAWAADAMPDLLQLGNTWIPEFGALGALEPLDGRVAASEAVDASDYFPGILDTNIVEGRLLGVPWYVDTRLLYYRKDILSGAGVTAPPRTWDEWAAAMEAVTRHVSPDRYAILLPLNEFEPQLSLALQQSDPLLREQDTRGNFDSPGFRRALAFYARIFEEGWAPAVSETQVSNVWDEFFRGTYAFYLSGPWNIREFRRRAPPELAGEWGTMPLPGPTGPGAGIAGGTSLVLPRGGAHADAAWRLVEHLSRPEVQRRFHALSGNLPPRRSTWEHPDLAGDPLAAAFRDQLERVRATPGVLEWERIAQELRLVTERVVRGRLSQDQAVRELDASVDAILAKRRWILAKEVRDAR